jgi:hypothetical protein
MQTSSSIRLARARRHGQRPTACTPPRSGGAPVSLPDAGWGEVENLLIYLGPARIRGTCRNIIAYQPDASNTVRIFLLRLFQPKWREGRDVPRLR